MLVSAAIDRYASRLLPYLYILIIASAGSALFQTRQPLPR